MASPPPSSPPEFVYEPPILYTDSDFDEEDDDDDDDDQEEEEDYSDSDFQQDNSDFEEEEDSSSADLDFEQLSDNAEEEEDENNDCSNPAAKLEETDFPNCPICFLPWTSEGPHRICCCPCGHVFGRSCLEKWLQRCRGTMGKCPQCVRKFREKDIVNIYAPVNLVSSDSLVKSLVKEVCSLREENESLKVKVKCYDSVVASGSDVSTAASQILVGQFDPHTTRMEHHLETSTPHQRKMTQIEVALQLQIQKILEGQEDYQRRVQEDCRSQIEQLRREQQERFAQLEERFAQLEQRVGGGGDRGGYGDGGSFDRGDLGNHEPFGNDTWIHDEDS